MTATPLLLCACCTSAAANADTSGHEHYCPATEPAPLEAVEGLVVVVCDGEGEHVEFARSSCDGCGSLLAGSRCPAEVLS
ncbi:hypothetical protein [Knoellia koreensis]|uniref:Secreted protein n=1 Tax=Knoellia koreensis TaxID=2730921 RepID=A0A849H9A5_9MICO|nr:hypothetical protein [Knoellia sp. DB2414S]NNM44515.1 hypothetical protein [Knoellia sp. DB2414S]